MTSLLGFASAASGLAGVGVAGHWSTRRRDSLGRPRPFPKWSILLLASLSVAAAVPGARRAIEERQLARVASQLAGHPVRVHCQSTAGALVDAGSELGFVPFDQDGVPLPTTTVKRDPCNDLRRYLGGHRQDPTYEEVVAVHVLTHESMHMRGATAEQVAECEAVQRDRVTASLLGATPAEAEQLALRYWLTVYPGMPADYFSQDCRPGGRLDEHLASAPWVH